MQRQQLDPPVVPERDPLTEEPREEPLEVPLEDPLEAGMEFSPQPTQDAARGRRDKVTPAGVGYREGEGEVRLRRELNLREAQISSLEKEVAKLKAQSQASRASTLFEEDDPLPRPKYEKPKPFLPSLPLSFLLPPFGVPPFFPTPSLSLSSFLIPCSFCLLTSSTHLFCSKSWKERGAAAVVNPCLTEILQDHLPPFPSCKSLNPGF
jgi:hypothetical protein